MIRTIHVCDRCGKSAESKEATEKLGLGDICLGFNIHSSYGYGSSSKVYAANQTWRKSWCRACRKELGILEKEIRKNKEIQVPSLEDMVREIVREEIPNE